MMYTPSSILMVRPDHFGFNTETARSNTFQKKTLLCETQGIRKRALAEFESFVRCLEEHQIDVFTFGSPKDRQAPDAVFPNNWISFHEDGKVIIYPMLTENRRIERQMEIVDEISKRFLVKEVIDLSEEEQSERILEGTGSMVFDHANKLAYANRSPRTNKELFYKVCEMLGYEGVFFRAIDESGMDIYHTNVLMAIGEGFAIICGESLDLDDKTNVIDALHSSDLAIIDISYSQMRHFAGNMIQLKSLDQKDYLVMSTSAFRILTDKQKKRLSHFAEFLHSDIHTIESIGGGSARCMIAGIHLKKITGHGK